MPTSSEYILLSAVGTGHSFVLKWGGRKFPLPLSKNSFPQDITDEDTGSLRWLEELPGPFYTACLLLYCLPVPQKLWVPCLLIPKVMGSLSANDIH